jgi:hypothetical protein
MNSGGATPPPRPSAACGKAVDELDESLIHIGFFGLTHVVRQPMV